MKLKPWLKAIPGRSVALAAHLGVSKSMVSQMANEKAPVPPTMYRAIRAFTNGEVDFEDLIPGDPQPAPSDVQIHPVTVAPQTVTAGAPPACEQQEPGQAEEDRKRLVPTAFGERRQRAGTKADRGSQGADTVQGA